MCEAKRKEREKPNVQWTQGGRPRTLTDMGREEAGSGGTEG
jgi:hypothetical protein